MMRSMPISRLTLKHIHIHNFRCHQDFNWNCGEHLNLISGDNGSGKTTILEAVYILAYGRSFRQAKAPQLARWGEDSFHIQATVKRYGPLHIRVDGKKGKVNMSLQGCKIVNRKDIFEHVSLIVDAPQGVRLIDGNPSERRKWLDRLVIASQAASYADYQGYLRALMQRGRLLRHGGSARELGSWEQQIVVYGTILNAKRAVILEKLNQYLAEESHWLDLPFQLEITKQPFENKEEWLLWLVGKREEQQRLGRITQGPHCDRLKISYSSREIRICGSRGQQKMSGIALRLAECAVLQASKRMMPILLLDDCFESLDNTRILRLLQRLQEHQGQVLMTAPSNMAQNMLKHVQQLSLNNG
ncbi:MAG: DNA replication and repair protein RecF [Ghiorsea sp.]|nr:DNA replication and repair protein RecF [Ghiorsea sp.]